MMKVQRIGWSYLLGVGLLTSPSIGLLGVISQPVLAQNVPASVRQGYTLLEQGLVDQAIATLQRAVREYPQSIEAKLGLAIAYRRAGRDEEALSTYEQVLELEPNNRLALLTIGTLGGYRSEWQVRGIEALTTLLTLNPQDTEARAQRALLYGYQGRYGEAIADYTIVLQSSPTPDVLVGAAEVYAYSGDHPRALELFNRYQATGEEIEGNATIPYALALRETGNPAQAVRVLEAELRQAGSELDSFTIQLRASLAVAYAANGQLNQAANVLTPLRGRQDSRLILARALNDVGRYSDSPAFTQEAISLYRQVLTQSPNLTVGVAREIADVLSGYPSEQTYALEVYRQLSQQQPSDVSLRVQLAVLERQMGLISEADLLQRLQLALQPFPTDPTQLRYIAQALTRLDSPSPALLPVYVAVVNSGVNEPFLNFRIAQILIEQNDFVSARNALALYSASPAGMQDQYAVILLLAEIDRREGNLDGAAQRYEMIIASNPSDLGILTGAFQGLAGIRQSQGRVAEAIALYDQIIYLNPQDYAKQLGRASLAYQAGIISEAEANTVLNTWLATRPLTDTPPELYSLAGALPAQPGREPLYTALLQADPNNTAIQLRYLQLIAAQNPDLAQAQLNQLIARDPNNLGAYFVQAQLAQELGNLALASESYEFILSRYPNNTDALAGLGGVRFQQRRYESAEQLYTQVLAMEPANRNAQMALIGLTAVQGRRVEALQRLEQMQLELAAIGVQDAELSREMQRIEEGFLQQRGFQPSWERY